MVSTPPLVKWIVQLALPELSARPWQPETALPLSVKLTVPVRPPDPEVSVTVAV